MMGDYSEGFVALKGRGRALPALNWSVSIVFKWVNIRVCFTFGDIDDPSLIAVTLFWRIPIPFA
jgi:hypothetical protein